MIRFPPRSALVPAAIFAFAALLWEGAPPGFALPATNPFSRCGGGVWERCVIDGDTFRYRGESIRIADINAPEVSSPRCDREAELSEAATERLAELLGQGAFDLEPIDRNRDRYGRLLREVSRGGESLGAQLVREGLAEPWRGYRGDWCG